MNAVPETINRTNAGEKISPAKEKTDRMIQNQGRAPFEKMTVEEQKAFVDGLREIVGAQWVATDPCILDTYAYPDERRVDRRHHAFYAQSDRHRAA